MTFQFSIWDAEVKGGIRAYQLAERFQFSIWDAFLKLFDFVL